MPDLPPLVPAVPRVRVIVYDLATGRIDHVATGCPENMAAAQAGPGQGTLVTPAGDGGERWYAPGGVLTLRPRLQFDRYVIAADGIDVARLELAGPFVAIIDGERYALADELEIVSDMPARYRVVIEDHFPFLDLDVEILAQ